jgi:hypothetical protein
MNNIYKVCIAMAAMFSISNASAATYTNFSTSETPFDVQLNTGGYGWSGITPTVQSTDITSTVPHSDSSSSTSIVVEETPAEIGVPGSVDVYQDTTTNTWTHDHTYNTQQALINHSDSLTPLQQTPESYTLTGSIEKQSGVSLYDSTGWLSFYMDLGISFENNPGGIDGSLSFEFGSDPEAWAYSYSTEFSGLTDAISLSDGESINLLDLIYFTATYSISGASASFSVDDISLGVYATSDSESTSNHNSETTTNRVLLSHTEIPALTAPVPIPPTVWLFGSGLLGLVGIARRKKA